MIRLFYIRGNLTTLLMCLVTLEELLLLLPWLFNFFLSQLLIKVSSWVYLCNSIKSKLETQNFLVKTIRAILMRKVFKQNLSFLLYVILSWWSFRWFLAASIKDAFVFVEEYGQNKKKCLSFLKKVTNN